MKRWRKITFIILIVVLAVPLTASVFIQIPAIQTAICGKAAETLNESIEGKIRIGSVKLVPFHTLIVGDVALSDNDGDTLFNSHKILLNIRGFSALSDTLVINRISIGNTGIDIRIDSEGRSNFEKVLGNLLKKKDNDTTKTILPWEGFKLRRLSIYDLNLKFNDKFAFTETNLAMRNVVVGKGIYGTIHALSLKEKSGLAVENLTSYFLVNSETALIKDFRYTDNYSDIKIPMARYEYDSVLVDATFDNSVIGLGSAGIVVPKLNGNELQIVLNGSVSGKVSDFATKDLTIKTVHGGTDIKIAAIVKGLPDIDNTDIRLNLKKSYTCVKDIADIAGAFSDSIKLSILDRINPNKKIKISCIAGGTPKLMDLKLNLDSEELGIIDAKVSTYTADTRYFAGEVSATNVELGKITGSKDLGKASAFLAGWAGMNPDSLRAEIVTAEISKFDFKGYRYNDISGGLTINKNHYSTELSSLDTNLFFKLKADLLIDKDGESHFAGSGNFNRIDFSALNLSKIDTCLTRFLVNFDFSGDTDNKYVGQLEFRDMMARLGSENFDIGNITLSSTEERDSSFVASIESSLLSVSYQGTDYLYGVFADAAQLFTSKIDHIVPTFKYEREKTGNVSGEFSLVTGDLKPIAALLPKDVYINAGTTLKLKMLNHKEMDLSLSSELLSMGDKFIKDMNLHVTCDKGPVNMLLTADMIQSGDNTIDRDTIALSLDKNIVSADISYNDRDDKFGNGKIKSIVNFPDTLTDVRKFYANILPSQLTINNKTLDIEPAKITMFRNKKVEIEGFKVSDSTSFLYLDGRIGESKQDTIKANLQNFNLAGLNFLFKKDVKLRGTLSGKCDAHGATGKNFSFLADFNGKELSADGERIGDIRLLGKWDEKSQKINYLLNNTLDGKRPLNVVGSYVPANGNLTLNVDVDNMNIGWIDPFLVTVLDHTKGTASGRIKVDGKIGDLKISSEEMRLNDLHTNLSYTKVPYILDGPFRIDETGVYIDKMSISDTKGSNGNIKGKYSFKGNDKGNIDLLFDLKNIHGLNTTYQDANQGFYGDANASGKVRVFGPMKGLRINIDITTEGGTVHIPLDETKSVKKRDILTFVDRRNIAQTAYDSIITLRQLGKGVTGRKTGVKCNVRLAVPPSTNLIVDINRSNGDKAAVVGNGQVEIKTGEGQFDIRGSYLVHEGLCHFSILGITAKDFIIQDGGAINFVGPVMQTEFKLAASYQTKASLETLFSDTKSVSARRTVNCIVNLTGKIDNPEIKFKIDVPDLEPTYKNKLDAALSTDEKNLRQGLALLVSGGFIPDQQSGIVNNSTFLYSNASEIVSNQLSNIFHQLNIPIDLGLKYQPGANGMDLFDVAISTQLFNNRVTINGSIGNKEYATSQSTSDIVGNVDVGIKLNKSGQLKLNLFSHAADSYSNYLDQSQRNGAGIIYQEEFATFKELWNNIFKRKRKQAAR